MEKIKNFLKTQKQYWKVPPKGRYMPYKEIISYSSGGMGVRLIVFLVQNMILGVGNTLIGNTIGIAPRPLYIIYIISVLSGFPLTALRARMIDNTRGKEGKYRPYIIKMGIPTVILGIGFVWMPYERMSLALKCVTVLLFNIGFQFFYNFLSDAYYSLVFLLSPNTIERSDVCAIRSIIENFTPSIVGIFLPIVASWITGDSTLYDIRIYRYIYPPLLFGGFFLAIIAYTGTKERIVQAKTHIIQVRLIDALRAVWRNKYFWIFSLANWLGFLEGAFDNILGWLYNYQKACSPAQYSAITAIIGNASFWNNVIAPGFIRKYGKRKILIVTNLMNIFLIFLLYPIVKSFAPAVMIWMLTAVIFINRLITALGHLLHPSIEADIRDYQHYITGERIDGMFAAVGLNERVAVSLGYSGDNVYDVLYNSEFFVKIASVLILSAVVGATLNVIPFFFYDLTETKQRAMVTVLKIRALLRTTPRENSPTTPSLKRLSLLKRQKSFTAESLINSQRTKSKRRKNQKTKPR